MSLEEAEGEGKWTREEDEAFETALADALPWKSEEEDEGDMRRWEELVGKVGTKTIEEVRKHYETLVDDIGAIEAGKVEVPNYVGEEEEEVEKEKGSESVDGGGGKSGLSKAEQERRKGIPWTEEEHKYDDFLSFVSNISDYMQNFDLLMKIEDFDDRGLWIIWHFRV